MRRDLTFTRAEAAVVAVAIIVAAMGLATRMHDAGVDVRAAVLVAAAGGIFGCLVAVWPHLEDHAG